MFVKHQCPWWQQSPKLLFLEQTLRYKKICCKTRMPQVATKSELPIHIIKVKVKSHQVIDLGVIWKCLVKYARDIWRLYLLQFKRYGKGLSFLPETDRSIGGWVVKLLACGARGPGFNSPPRHLNFRDWLSHAFKSRYGWNTAKAT